MSEGTCRKRKVSGEDESPNKILKNTEMEGTTDFVDPFPDLDPNTPTEQRITLYLQHIIGKLSRIEGRLDKIENKILTLEKTSDTHSVKIEEQDKIIKAQNQKIQQLEDLVEDLYCDSKRNNIIIKGLNVNSKTNLYEKVSKVFQDLGSKRRPRIEKVHMLGKTKKVLVRFGGPEEKSYLYRNSKRMQKKGLGLDEDLPPKMREEHNLLLKKRREILDNGVAKSVKVFRRSLLLDEKEWYTLNPVTKDITRAPEDEAMSTQ